ncbi:hypothetical protein G6F22_019474 [Rhizopus arrhizus]|nr:hypothetical protein G6F22_019474 [Rhizopus arrhizus]
MQRCTAGGLEGAAHAVDQLGLAGPAYLVAGQVQFPAAHPRGAVGAFQEILAALQLAVQGLGLADLRHQRAALFQHLGGAPGQVHHQPARRRRQHAGHRGEQAQRADARTVRRAQRDAGVVADARAAGDQRIAGKARVLAGVWNLEQRILLDARCWP